MVVPSFDRHISLLPYKSHKTDFSHLKYLINMILYKEWTMPPVIIAHNLLKDMGT